MTAKGSSNGGGRRRAAATLAAAAVRLRGCRWRWLQQGCGCNRGKMGQRSARLLQRRTAVVWRERPLLVVFTSMLAAIKAVGSERLLLVAFL
ncbi:hypothetical protein BHE74_00052580 [Ensete ventricosum]|nr:hypothetical protein BHE74_00052580 [Ensete ventricosum]